MAELALSSFVPLWRTLHEAGVTAAITPDLDYVGALELGALDARFASAGALAGLGEGLRRLVSSLEDGTTLQVLYRVVEDCEDFVSSYESGVKAQEPLLREYVQERAAWLRKQRLRQVRIYLCFSGPPLKKDRTRFLGTPMRCWERKAASAEDHAARLYALSQLRDRLVERLGSLGVPARELSVEEVQTLYAALLNPERTRAGDRPPRVQLREDLWTKQGRLDARDLHVLEYTEAEQLCSESVEEYRGYLRQGETYRRVCALHTLPEGGTSYEASQKLLGLHDDGGGPFGYTLSVTVHVQAQAATRWLLSTTHRLVEVLRHSLPFLQSRSVDEDAGANAQRSAIEGLMAELHELSTKLCLVSASVLLEADSLELLDKRTEGARKAFSDLGNAQAIVDPYGQLQGLLAMLPGSGRYQVHPKGCTSRNAADLLPLFGPWRGSERAVSLFQSPAGDAFRLDTFDESLGAAGHGIVCAPTGSGKSVTLATMTLDMLAKGVDAILIDNGGSWKPLTEVLGGTHIPVDLKTSLCPFPALAGVLKPGTNEIDPQAVQDVVTFLEVCLTDRTLPGFDNVQKYLVARAVASAYETHFRKAPQERPVVGHFRDALLALPGSAEDRQIASSLGSRLRLYTEGLYADLLNRPSKLRFDARLLTFDLAGVSQNPATKTLAMATLVLAVTHRAQSKKSRTLVEVDEGHQLLGQSELGERFLESCWRQMRKHDVAMWLISQGLSDFTNTKGGSAIVANSKVKLFLRHDSGHEAVARHFGLSARAAEAFASLQKHPGRYSDAFLMNGDRIATLRLALHPFAYWLLTTHPPEVAVRDRARAKNPHLHLAQVLHEVAALYPHGLEGAAIKAA